jgi:hypothetical protein
LPFTIANRKYQMARWQSLYSCLVLFAVAVIGLLSIVIVICYCPCPWLLLLVGAGAGTGSGRMPEHAHQEPRTGAMAMFYISVSISHTPHCNVQCEEHGHSGTGQTKRAHATCYFGKGPRAVLLLVGVFASA